VPRNRSGGGLAALSSSVRRTTPRPYSGRKSAPVKRRIVVGVLAFVSLALITGYFREADDGPLHDVQGVASTAMHPFEVGAERIARPFRDAYAWLSDLFNAREENEQLKQQLEQLRNQAIQNSTAATEVKRLQALLDYRKSDEFPADYDAVGAAVLADPPSDFEQFIIISAGSNDGVRVNAPVVTDEGLVGKVTRVSGEQSRVALLTDKESAASAYDVSTEADGVIRHGAGGGDALILDRVAKDARVERGDLVATSGRRFQLLPSIYPRNIQIGTVTSVGQTDIDANQQIQVDPFVDFDSVDAVLVLIRKTPEPSFP
jgi:rod shape-determining protein MreC